MNGLLSVFIAEVSIISLAVFLAITFKKRLLETLFLASGLAILVLFFFGILGFRGGLLLGYMLILGLSVVAITLSARAIFRNKSLISQIDFWRGLLVIGVFTAVSLFINYNRWFISWDEFSHWGIVVKHIYSLDALGSIHGSRLLFPDYFPGISLFEYFFTRGSSLFVEYPVFIASNFLFFSMVATFIKKIDVKTVLIVAAFVLSPIIAGSTIFFSNILVDTLMGCIFGFTIIIYLLYLRDIKDRFGIILFSTSLAVLTISKDIGIVLAVLALAVCTLDILLYRRKELSEVFSRKNIKKSKQPLLLLVPLIAIVVSWLLYKINLKLSGVHSSWQGFDIGSLLSGNLKEYQHSTIKNFWQTFFNVSDSPLPISFFWAMLALLGVLIVWSIFIKNRLDAKRILTIGLSIFAGSFLYGLMIMTLYVLIFSEYEAVKLASYERYMDTYLVGFMFFVVGTFLYETRFLGTFYKRYKSPITLVLFLSAVVLGFLISYEIRQGGILYDIAHSRREVSTTINARAPYEAVKEWKACLNNQSDKLNIIVTNTKGNERNIIMYNLYPITAQSYYRNDYSVGEKPYDSGDMWTLIKSPEGWQGYIESNYTLVYVYKYDEAFRNSYGRYFDNLKNNQLYKVEKSGNTIELKSINKTTCQNN